MESTSTTNNMQDYLRYSPPSAVLDGKGEDEQWVYNALFLMMGDAAREYLASTKVADIIRSWIDSGLVPETHGLAIAKLVGLIAYGEVSLSSVPDLLVKLDIPAEKAQKISTEVENLLQPIEDEYMTEATPENAKEKSRPTLPSRPTSTGVPLRNIIDLRNKTG